VLFIVIIGGLSLWLEDELMLVTTAVVNQIGFLGLCLILLVTDTLVTPFPPDLLLLVIAKSPLSEEWFGYVTILGCVSVCAGMIGWKIGQKLGGTRLAKRIFGDIQPEQREFIQKYGFWAIVIGAITPLPFSVTCWAAGILKVRWQIVLTAAVLFRIPRFVLYYWLIISTAQLFGA
ncbi:MAG: VTT domain-containing protein, partial [Pseudomonadota bacterium]|nr:VTT domain-containing protein [Pseudomonadota bacterium]